MLAGIPQQLLDDPEDRNHLLVVQLSGEIIRLKINDIIRSNFRLLKQASPQDPLLSSLSNTDSHIRWHYSSPKSLTIHVHPYYIWSDSLCRPATIREAPCP